MYRRLWRCFMWQFSSGVWESNCRLGKLMKKVPFGRRVGGVLSCYLCVFVLFLNYFISLVCFSFLSRLFFFSRMRSLCSLTNFRWPILFSKKSARVFTVTEYVSLGPLLINFYWRIFHFLNIFVATSFVTSWVQEKNQLIGPPGSALMIISLVCKTERLIARNCSLN